MNFVTIIFSLYNYVFNINLVTAPAGTVYSLYHQGLDSKFSKYCASYSPVEPTNTFSGFLFNIGPISSGSNYFSYSSSHLFFIPNGLASRGWYWQNCTYFQQSFCSAVFRLAKTQYVNSLSIQLTSPETKSHILSMLIAYFLCKNARDGYIFGSYFVEPSWASIKLLAGSRRSLLRSLPTNIKPLGVLNQSSVFANLHYRMALPNGGPSTFLPYRGKLYTSPQSWLGSVHSGSSPHLLGYSGGGSQSLTPHRHLFSSDADLYGDESPPFFTKLGVLKYPGPLSSNIDLDLILTPEEFLEAWDGGERGHALGGVYKQTPPHILSKLLNTHYPSSFSSSNLLFFSWQTYSLASAKNSGYYDHLLMFTDTRDESLEGLFHYFVLAGRFFNPDRLKLMEDTFWGWRPDLAEEDIPLSTLRTRLPLRARILARLFPDYRLHWVDVEETPVEPIGGPFYLRGKRGLQRRYRTDSNGELPLSIVLQGKLDRASEKVARKFFRDERATRRAARRARILHALNVSNSTTLTGLYSAENDFQELLKELKQINPEANDFREPIDFKEHLYPLSATQLNKVDRLNLARLLSTNGSGLTDTERVTRSEWALLQDGDTPAIMEKVREFKKAELELEDKKYQEGAVPDLNDDEFGLHYFHEDPVSSIIVTNSGVTKDPNSRFIPLPGAQRLSRSLRPGLVINWADLEDRGLSVGGVGPIGTGFTGHQLDESSPPEIPLNYLRPPRRHIFNNIFADANETVYDVVDPKSGLTIRGLIEAQHTHHLYRDLNYEYLTAKDIFSTGKSGSEIFHIGWTQSGLISGENSAFTEVPLRFFGLGPDEESESKTKLVYSINYDYPDFYEEEDLPELVPLTASDSGSSGELTPPPASLTTTPLSDILNNFIITPSREPFITPDRSLFDIEEGLEPDNSDVGGGASQQSSVVTGTGVFNNRRNMEVDITMSLGMGLEFLDTDLPELVGVLPSTATTPSLGLTSTPINSRGGSPSSRPASPKAPSSFSFDGTMSEEEAALSVFGLDLDDIASPVELTGGLTEQDLEDFNYIPSSGSVTPEGFYDDGGIDDLFGGAAIGEKFEKLMGMPTSELSPEDLNFSLADTNFISTQLGGIHPGYLHRSTEHLPQYYARVYRDQDQTGLFRTVVECLDVSEDLPDLAVGEAYSFGGQFIDEDSLESKEGLYPQNTGLEEMHYLPFAGGDPLWSFTEGPTGFGTAPHQDPDEFWHHLDPDKQPMGASANSGATKIHSLTNSDALLLGVHPAYLTSRSLEEGYLKNAGLEEPIHFGFHDNVTTPVLGGGSPVNTEGGSSDGSGIGGLGFGNSFILPESVDGGLSYGTPGSDSSSSESESGIGGLGFGNSFILPESVDDGLSYGTSHSDSSSSESESSAEGLDLLQVNKIAINLRSNSDTGTPISSTTAPSLVDAPEKQERFGTRSNVISVALIRGKGGDPYYSPYSVQGDSDELPQYLDPNNLEQQLLDSTLSHYLKKHSTGYNIVTGVINLEHIVDLSTDFEGQYHKQRGVYGVGQFEAALDNILAAESSDSSPSLNLEPFPEQDAIGSLEFFLGRGGSKLRTFKKSLLTLHAGYLAELPYIEESPSSYKKIKIFEDIDYPYLLFRDIDLLKTMLGCNFFRTDYLATLRLFYEKSIKTFFLYNTGLTKTLGSSTFKGSIFSFPEQFLRELMYRQVSYTKRPFNPMLLDLHPNFYKIIIPAFFPAGITPFYLVHSIWNELSSLASILSHVRSDSSLHSISALGRNLMGFRNLLVFFFSNYCSLCLLADKITLVQAKAYRQQGCAELLALVFSITGYSTSIEKCLNLLDWLEEEGEDRSGRSLRGLKSTLEYKQKASYEKAVLLSSLLKNVEGPRWSFYTIDPYGGFLIELVFPKNLNGMFSGPFSDFVNVIPDTVTNRRSVLDFLNYKFVQLPYGLKANLLGDLILNRNTLRSITNLEVKLLLRESLRRRSFFTVSRICNSDFILKLNKIIEGHETTDRLLLIRKKIYFYYYTKEGCSFFDVLSYLLDDGLLSVSTTRHILLLLYLGYEF